MTLHQYIRSLSYAERLDLAQRCGTSFGHLRNVAYGKSCAPDLAVAIERETGGGVTVADLRPEFAESLERAGYVRMPADERAAA